MCYHNGVGDAALWLCGAVGTFWNHMGGANCMEPSNMVIYHLPWAEDNNGVNFENILLTKRYPAAQNMMLRIF